MGVYRLFTDSNGESRIEEYDKSELANFVPKGAMRFTVQENER